MGEKPTEVKVACGRCGHALVDLEVSTREELELLPTLVDERFGDSIECPRCHYVTVPASWKGSVEEPVLVRRARDAEAQRQTIKGVRWGVRGVDGRRSSVWRLWVNGDDVYIADRDTAGDAKISLHQSGKWRFAFSEKAVARADSLIPADADRAWHKWDRPPEVAPGWTRAVTIVMPTSELARGQKPKDPEKIVWLDAPREGYSTHFNVVLSAPGARASSQEEDRKRDEGGVLIAPNLPFALGRGHELFDESDRAALAALEVARQAPMGIERQFLQQDAR